MEATFHMDGNVEVGQMLETYLLKAPTFQTPSFCDDDFPLPVVTSVHAQCEPNYSQGEGHYSGQNHFFPPSSLPPLTGVTQSLQTSQLTSPLTSQLDVNNCNTSVSNAINANPYAVNLGLDSLCPKFPPAQFDIPDICVSRSVIQNRSISQPTGQALFGYPTSPPPSLQGSVQNQGLLTLAQTTLPPSGRNHLIIAGMNRHIAGSGPNQGSPIRESDESSDDSLPLAQLALKRSPSNAAPLPTGQSRTAPSAGKRARTTKKRKKKDPNEPQKPVSAYALFFRDTQAAIKSQNPSATFGEVSKIVASMWDSLDEEYKNDYKKRTEQAKKEYLKQLASYRASLVSTGQLEKGVERLPGPHSSPLRPTMDNSMPPPRPPMDTYAHVTHNGTTPLVHLADPGLCSMSPPQDPAIINTQPPPMPQTTFADTKPHLQDLTTHARIDASPPITSLNFINDGHDSVCMPAERSLCSPDNTVPGSMCLRNGCHNPPVQHPSWDNEYCSTDCVVSHCRDVFTAWVASRQTVDYASVK